jgi:hypothetical protein
MRFSFDIFIAHKDDAACGCSSADNPIRDAGSTKASSIR